MSIVTYSDYTDVKLPFGEGTNKCALRDAFRDLSHTQWPTRLEPVLRETFKKFRKSKAACKVLCEWRCLHLTLFDLFLQVKVSVCTCVCLLFVALFYCTVSLFLLSPFSPSSALYYLFSLFIYLLPIFCSVPSFSINHYFPFYLFPCSYLHFSFISFSPLPNISFFLFSTPSLIPFFFINHYFPFFSSYLHFCIISANLHNYHSTSYHLILLHNSPSPPPFYHLPHNHPSPLLPQSSPSSARWGLKGLTYWGHNTSRSWG